MPKSKEQKQSALEGIKEKISNAKSIVFTDYRGMKMSDIEILRKSIKKQGGKFEIAKITLVGKAFENKDKVKEIVNKSSLAIAYSINDEVGVAKEIKKFSKTNQNIQIIGGFYEGNFLTKAEMEKLADLPSKEELIVKLLATINSPASKLVRNIGDQTPKLVRTLKAIVDKG